MSVDLSIVVAAYNEARRLPRTLERWFSYLDKLGVSYEIVVVDDGSRDGTRAAVDAIAAERGEVRVLSHYPNRGRGRSVREGIAAARGDYILETDADGSTRDEAIGRFVDVLRSRPDVDVLIGSRELASSRVLLPQPFLRLFLGKGFIYLAKMVLWSFDVRDFTLGFKMFRRAAARDIFAYQYDDHFVAEAEIVYVAKRRGWTVVELPVDWDDDRESRVRPLREAFRSLRGVVAIRERALRGRYAGPRRSETHP